MDPKVEVEHEFPTHGKICEAMEYFDFNPTMIEKWDRLARMDHPISGTHYYLQWLGYAKGYRAVVVSDFQLDDEVVALRGLDRARAD